MSKHPRYPTLTEIVNLRLSVLEQHELFSNRGLAKRAVYREYKNILNSAKKAGVVECFLKNGKLRSALIISEKPIFYHGKPYLLAKILLRGNDPEALRWMRGALMEHRRFFKKPFLIRLDEKNRELLADLRKLNVNIQLAIFGGDPKLALKKLIEHYGPLSWKDHPEFEVRHLRTEAEIEKVISIMKSEFKLNPRYGWMIGSKEFLKNEREMLDRQRRKKRKTNYIVLKNGKIVGHFGFQASQGDPFGRRSASMTLNFGRTIQKRGLAKLAYFTLLTRMCELEIENFLGATAQEPVLKLSRLMKRPLIAYMLKTGKPHFKPSYFSKR